SARWGDHQRPDRPYDRDNDWLKEQNRLLKEYFPERTDVVMRLYRQEGLFPKIDAPAFSQHGGIVANGFGISLTADIGTIYYTTDGTDPRHPGGAISDSAKVLDDGSLQILSDTTIKSRAFHDGEWSALNEVSFVVASPLNLRVTEINANPHQPNLTPHLNESAADNSAFEFVELQNVGDASINLKGVQLVETIVDYESEGISFVFAEQDLDPGERIVVVRDRAAFESRYGQDMRIASGGSGQQEFGGELNDDGEQIMLLDANGLVIQQFQYDVDKSPSSRSRGHGSTIEVIDASGDYGDSSNWSESVEFGGSPGSAGSGSAGQIIINEILAPDGTAGGWIELHNTTDQDFDISNWHFSSTAANVFESTFAPGTSIAAGGFLSVPLTQLGLKFDAARGGTILLIEADDLGAPVRFVDSMSYPTMIPGVSAGRSPIGAHELVTLERATKNERNAEPLLGEVVVSEVHFYSPDLDGKETGQRSEVFEFIELFNRSEIDVDLTGWRVSGDVDYLFRNGPVVSSGQTVLVVSFQPNRSTQANPFREAFGIDKSVKLVGPYVGHLNDRQGTVRLEKPLPPPADAPYLSPFAILDEVDFTSRSPWPESTSGTGDSLTRQNAKFGNSPENWIGKSPSPGTSDLTIRWQGDVNGDGLFTSRDIVFAMIAGKYETGAAATFAEGDWNGDGVFDSADLVAALTTGRYEA
ncbi:MAG: lamin tail domain-containing protein, partial [Planctomycetales bacterium]|nr:lamin tail domain-containing protein [Planctomycetales bacterium]